MSAFPYTQCAAQCVNKKRAGIDMGDRNTAQTQEAPSSYLQGKHHTVTHYAGAMLLIALNNSDWTHLICCIFHY